MISLNESFGSPERKPQHPFEDLVLKVKSTPKNNPEINFAKCSIYCNVPVKCPLCGKEFVGLHNCELKEGA